LLRIHQQAEARCVPDEPGSNGTFRHDFSSLATPFTDSAVPQLMRPFPLLAETLKAVFDSNQRRDFVAEPVLIELE
jgi:hypothetical protein